MIIDLYIARRLSNMFKYVDCGKLSASCQPSPAQIQSDWIEIVESFLLTKLVVVTTITNICIQVEKNRSGLTKLVTDF
jgi:hypothetical protein